MTPRRLSRGIALFQLLVMPCQKYLVCTFISFLPGYLLTCHKTVTPISKENICPREQDYLLSERAQVLKGWVIPMLALATGCQACFSIFRERRFSRSTRLHWKGLLFCLFFISMPALKEKILSSSFFMVSYRHMLSLWSSKLLRYLLCCRYPLQRVLDSTGPDTGGSSVLLEICTLNLIAQNQR